MLTKTVLMKFEWQNAIGLFCCILITCFGHAQDFSNRGTDFWVGYGHHQYMEPTVPPGTYNTQEMVLYLSAEQPANVTVTIDGTTWIRNYSIPANTVIATEYIPKAGTIDARLISVPCSFVPPGTPCGGEGVFANKGIHITSDVPIVAYAHIFGNVSSGATMLLPVDTWGYTYTSINSQQIDALGPAYTWVYAIAKENNTVIRVTPSVITRTGQPGGVSYNITLQRGEIYQVVGQSDANGNGNQFTGTTIESIANPAGECYPVAVFSGSSRTKGETVPCGTSSGRDNDMQQAFPRQAWGKRYLTAPFSSASGPSNNVNLNASVFQTSVYKIVVKDPATVIRRNGTVLTGLITPGNYYQYASNTADYIVSDKPIMIGQFMSGASGCNPGSWGDPEMVFLSPIEQAIKHAGFYRNDRQSIYANYVTVIIPTAGLSSLTINGSSTFTYTYAHPNLTGYSIAIKGWQASQSQAVLQSDSAFTAITYGLGSAESYAYNAGTYIKNLSAVSSIHNTLDPATPQHAFTCTNTPVELSVLMAYQPTRLDWLLSQLGSVVSPNTDVIDNAPVSTGTVVINGITYYKYTLPGTYLFNVADTFDISINGYHPSIENCYQREQLKVPVIVKGSPQADFTFTHTGCTLDTVYFSGNATTSNSFTIRDFNWTFPGPVTATGQLVNKVLPPGIHNISLSVVSNEGCVGDTIKQITIYDKPPANFQIVPASLCEGSSFTITDTSSASIAVNQWYWDFGNGVTQNITTGPSVTYTYPLPGTYTIKHVARSSASCVSDTVSRQVTVYAKPAVSFTASPSGCLDVSGNVQFTGIASASDGQAFTTYNWNFNDPNATAGNPNTSGLQNPVHSFQQGTYNIQFFAITANGCSDTITTPTTFNVKPQLAFNVLNPVCENVPGTVSVAGASVVNSVTGSGIYHGTATNAAGDFTPSAAGPGTHTIWYVYTTTAGCVDSMSMNILVHAKPDPGFTFPNNGCLPASGQVQFTNTSTIADAQTMTWLWNFNDPNANAGNPNTSTAQNPSHNYGEGTFNISLLVTSSNGCADSVTVPATFAVTPVLNYPALNAVCENATILSIATATVTNGIAGTGVYSGPGTNAAGQFNPLAAGPGNHTITYTFTTTGGCVQPVTQTILVHAKPGPGFTFPTGACLPSTGLVQFTNTTTIADAQTMTWLWTFNDPNANGGNPNTSTAQHPTHNFGEGSFPVNLTVTSSNGCVKDTTISALFAVTPVLNYPPLNAVCQSAAPLSVATALVTNGITGTGIYSGAGTNAAGLFDPSLAGPGIHTITYTFTTAGGCTQSIPRTIEVYPRPIASFTAVNSICLNQTSTLTNTSTIPSGAITAWNWNLGDGNTASYSNGNPFTVSYASANNYTVQLIAVSDRGCISSTTSQTIAVHPLPIANFNVPTGICMPGGSATFTNLSTVPDNSALSYQWNFGDGTGTSVAANPSYVYGSTGTYNVTLTATSAFGCVNTSTPKVVSDFYDKPVASFTVTPDELCQGVNTVFNDQSSAPNSSIQSWSWNFDDGSPLVTVQTPVKQFPNPGIYDITLTVTNTVGCVSDVFPKTVTVHLQPVIDAGRSFVVSQGATVQFAATANSPSLTFNWTPPAGLSDATALKPTLTTAMADETYTLTATGEFGCTATDFITIQILKPVKVPNVFSPNGDGVHDKWVIANLADYPGCTVQVFNRYGQQVFYSEGYGTPWDGTIKGKDLPLGAYYYIIQLQSGFKPMTGSVTIVK